MRPIVPTPIGQHIHSALEAMNLAAQLADGQKGHTGESPSVGAVITDKTGHIIGFGATADGGRPHGEYVALEMANASGARRENWTLYVTLEPCAHVSEKGPSCSAIILGAPIKTVIIGFIDPDPRTKGKGIAALNLAGIKTELLPTDQAGMGLAEFFARFS